VYRRYYDDYRRIPDVKSGGEIVVPQTIEKNENHKVQSATPNDIAIADTGCKKSGLNLPFELDDLILIGILLFLLFDKDDCKKDDNNDIFVLIIAGLILFSDIF